MGSLNAGGGKKIRNFSVHLTRLTDEDIDNIRCELKRKAEEKVNKNPKAKNKNIKSSNCQFFEATTASSGNNISLKDRSQKPTKIKSKKKPTSVSSKRSRKKKCTRNISSKKVVLDSRTSTWDDRSFYSTSEESELEEVLVPRKIWVKPSARPMSPTLSKSDTAAGSLTHEIPHETERNITTTKSLIRQPVVLLKKVILDADIKHEICDHTMPSTSGLQARNSSNTNCCLQWQEAFQRYSTRAVTISSRSHKEGSESEDSADEKLPQLLQTADESCENDDKPPVLTNEELPQLLQTADESCKNDDKPPVLTNEELPQLLQTADESCKNDDKPPVLTNEVAPYDLASRTESIAMSEITSTLKITGHSSLRCSCQLTVASQKAITSDAHSKNPESSNQSTPLTSAVVEASTQSTVSLRDVSAAARNQSDDTILSPVIFDEESPATREFSREVSSPVIFGSNEGTAVESVDAPNGSSNQYQEAISDASNSSSSFCLELSVSEPSDTEAPSENCDLVSDASQNFNLQLSENMPRQNIQSRTNSQESVSNCSFALEIPGECTIEDFSKSKNSQLVSSSENMLSSKTNQSSSSETEAPYNFSELEAASIPENENSNQFMNELNFSGSQKIHSSAPPYLPENQKIFLYSVKSLNPTRQKISLLKKIQSLSDGGKNDSSIVEDSSFSRSHRTYLLTAKASHLMKKNLSGLEASNMSTTKKSCSSFSELPNCSVTKKSCMSVSDAANLCRRNYSLPLKRLNPSSTKKSNSPLMESTKMPASAPINCNNVFTQTDLQEVHQQPSQLSVNYIINSSNLDTIRFEGPVVNHPSTMTAIGEKIPASDSTCIADELHFPRVFSPNGTNRIPCKCNVRNFFHHREVSDLPKSESQLEKSSNAHAHATTKLTACCSDSTLHCGKTAKQRCRKDEDDQFLASKTVIDWIDLTGDDELECGEPLLGKIRLKTPSELGCTIVFTDDLERLYRHELPKLPCDFDKLDLLKRRHFYIFKLALAQFSHGKQVIDTLQKLCSTRSVPCGSNLMRHSLPVGLTSTQLFVKSPALQNLTGQKLFYGNSGGIANLTHDSVLVKGGHDNATILGRPTD